MPKVPTYFHQPQGGQPLTVAVDPHLNDPVYEANQSIARGVEQMGDVVFDYAQKMQHARDVRDTINAQEAYRRTHKEFVSSRRNLQGGEEKWMEEYNAKMSSVKADTSNMSGRARKDFEDWKKNFILGGELDVNLIVDSKTAERTKEAVTREYNSAIQEGDNKAAEMAVAKGFDASVFSDVETEKMIADIPNLIAQSYAGTLIKENSYQAMELLSAKDEDGNYLHLNDLTAKQRNEMQNLAKSTWNHDRRGALDTITARFESGKFMSDNELAAYQERGLITKTEAAKFSVDQRAKIMANPESQPPFYNEALGMISGYDPLSAELGADGKIIAYIDSHLSGQLHARAMKLFNEKMNPDSVLNSDVGKHGLNIINQNFKEGIYGEWETIPVYETNPDGTFKLENGKKVPVFDSLRGRYVFKADREKLEQARATQARIIDALVQELQRNPNMRYEEVQGFIADALDEIRSKNSVGILSGMLTPAPARTMYSPVPQIVFPTQ